MFIFLCRKKGYSLEHWKKIQGHG